MVSSISAIIESKLRVKTGRFSAPCCLFLTVCPGVRLAEAVASGTVQDQKRVMTPAAAKEIGSDYIVVGRPITAADDPVAAYRRCVAEFVD